MKENKRNTFIKKDHKFGSNKQVLGRILGIGYCMQNYKDTYPIYKFKDGRIYIGKFTDEQYEKFKSIIEKLYPGLCEFDYTLKESK